MTIQDSPAIPVTDRQGRPMFTCHVCAAPMTHADFFEQSLRLPDADESAADYCDAELVDTFMHVACARAERGA